MADLIVHKGGWEASRTDLAAVPVPPETDTWIPVPYGRLIEELHLHVPRFGLEIAGEQYALAREGGQMFGVLSCKAPNDTGDFTLALGIRNSYDRSLSVGLCVGTRVFVCDNLAFSGEVSTTRKHTLNVFRDLPDQIYKMLSKLPAMHTRQQQEIGRMKELQITDAWAHHLMVEAVKRDALPASMLPKVLEEWEHPRFAEFNGGTAWSLYNGFSLVQKSRSPRAQMENTLKIHTLFRDLILPQP